jgi:hypothetical protein
MEDFVTWVDSSKIRRKVRCSYLINAARFLSPYPQLSTIPIPWPPSFVSCRMVSFVSFFISTLSGRAPQVMKFNDTLDDFDLLQA